MFKQLLLAVDGSAIAENAALHGLELAGALGAKVTAVTVTVPWATQFAREAAVVVPDAVVPQAEFDSKMDAYAARILGRVSEAAKAAGVACKTLHIRHSLPYQGIIDAAESEGCDVIVMGSHGHRGFKRLLLGSETMKVLTHCTRNVLVHRQT